jgi:GNAT superfamily N-acetyltransferase
VAHPNASILTVVHQLVSFSTAHTDGVSALCAAQGWPSWTPERTERALSAPGVIAVVALDDVGEVVGVAQMLTDGAVVAYLGVLVVAHRLRGQGLGRKLMLEAARRTGLERFDLLSEDDALPFYESFPHKRKPGVRIYSA